MRFSTLLTSAILCALGTTSGVYAGPIAYGVCQTGCNTVAVACYVAAGAVFGTVIAAPAVPAAIIGCNAALGTCSTMCATVALLAPTP